MSMGHLKQKWWILFRLIIKGTAAYSIGAGVVCLLYILFSVLTGLGQEIIGIAFLLMMGTIGAFLGGILLERFLGDSVALKQRGALRLGVLSALVEALGITAGSVILAFLVAAQEAGIGPSEFLAFSTLGLVGVTILNAVHGAALAGSLFPDKPRWYFVRLSAIMALSCGILCGLPYLWVMSGLPMSYKGIEYQMLVPVLITVISLGATTGTCIGMYSIKNSRS